MTDDQTDTEALELLRGLGWVAPPADAVLAAAREPLWSAITDELLSADPADDAGQPQRRDVQRLARRRRPGQVSPEDRHRHAPPACG